MGEEDNFLAALKAASAEPTSVELVEVMVAPVVGRQLAVRKLAMEAVTVSSQFDAKYATAAAANSAVTASAGATFIDKYNTESTKSKDNDLYGTRFSTATRVD